MYTIESIIKGICKSAPKPKAQTIPPKNKEPVSPIKTLAGCKFHTKNPKQPPAKAAASKLIPNIPKRFAITIKNTAMKKVTEVCNPSIHYKHGT